MTTIYIVYVSEILENLCETLQFTMQLADIQYYTIFCFIFQSSLKLISPYSVVSDLSIFLQNTR